MPSTTVTGNRDNLGCMWHGRGNRIKQLREDRGWSGSELARRLRLTRQAIAKWEDDDTINISGSSLAAICAIFGVSQNYILFGTDAGALESREPTVEYCRLHLSPNMSRFSAAERTILEPAYRAWAQAIEDGNPIAVIAARALIGIFG